MNVYSIISIGQFLVFNVIVIHTEVRTKHMIGSDFQLFNVDTPDSELLVVVMWVFGTTITLVGSWYFPSGRAIACISWQRRHLNAIVVTSGLILLTRTTVP
jgi:hypothetical protein